MLSYGYTDKIIMLMQPLHNELYTLDPERFFVNSFLDAVKDGSEAAIRRILTEHSPGVFTFNMLKPSFCAKMLEEVCTRFLVLYVSIFAVMLSGALI